MQNILSLFAIIITALVALFTFYAFVISWMEKEKRAALISFIAVLLLSSFSLILYDLHRNDLAIVGESMMIFYVIVGLLFSYNCKKKIHIPEQATPIDERDTMFSRSELTVSTENYETYYRENPEKKVTDDKYRSNAGLLSPKSLFYHPLSYASADSSFEIISHLRTLTHQTPKPLKQEINPQRATAFVKGLATHFGAHSVGITLLKPAHIYSKKGRGDAYGTTPNNCHKFAIAFTVEMQHELVINAPKSGIIIESSKQYLNSGIVALQLATTIRNLGYEATAHIDGKYDVVCPLVAADANLGEIGRMGLLITPTLGPRVRLAVVTTDLEMQTDTRKVDKSVYDFCNNCMKCADLCPTQSIPKSDYDFKKHWQINQDTCFEYWTKTGTDCGVCLKVCPYAHPNNFFHKVIRFGIANSWLFRRIAAPLDNLFYGKKIVSHPLPNWIEL